MSCRVGVISTFWEHRAEVEVLFFYSIAGGRVRAMLVFLSVPVSSVLTHAFWASFLAQIYPPFWLAAFAPQYDGRLFGGSNFHGIVMTHKFLAPAPENPLQ